MRLITCDYMYSISTLCMMPDTVQELVLLLIVPFVLLQGCPWTADDA